MRSESSISCLTPRPASSLTYAHGLTIARPERWPPGATYRPGTACWVFVPTKTKLELLGTDVDDGWRNAANLQSGWSFETVFTPTPASADNQAWRWRRRRFVRETNVLTPGVGYWIYRP